VDSVEDAKSSVAVFLAQQEPHVNRIANGLAGVSAMSQNPGIFRDGDQLVPELSEDVVKLWVRVDDLKQVDGDHLANPTGPGQFRRHTVVPPAVVAAGNQLHRLLEFLESFDPFSPAPFRSTRKFLTEIFIFIQ